MEDQGDRRARPRTGAEPAFETALGTRKNDFGHVDPIRNQGPRRVLAAEAERPI
jgi:hypothetical protein